MDKNKIALGTAQFGLDYGISNKTGQIPENEVFDILNESMRSGIDVLDTAYVYGNSELVIGNYTKKHRHVFKIISKLPECDPKDVKNIFESSLEWLGADDLYGYMCHSFQHYRDNPEIWSILKTLKSEGKINKIGLSLYYPSELEYIIENKINVDIIQVPYNVFDRRFEQYFPVLKNKGVEIFVRSVFLQGLVFKEPSELDDYFAKIKGKIATLHSLAAELDIPIASLCLNFAVLNEFVDQVVVGVDSIQNLKEIVSSFVCNADVKNVLKKLDSLREVDENMILPTNWKVSR
jgi:aryl-alcohol dehydrogenase-like predicted oxidoreductase